MYIGVLVIALLAITSLIGARQRQARDILRHSRDVEVIDHGIVKTIPP